MKPCISKILFIWRDRFADINLLCLDFLSLVALKILQIGCCKRTYTLKQKLSLAQSSFLNQQQDIPAIPG